MSRVLVFDRRGTPLDEVDALTTRSWVLNGEGDAEWYMATSDAKTTEINLRYGNFVLIQQDNLPDWIGVIEGGREWTPGRVKVRANTLERLMRNCGSPIVLGSGSAGSLFRAFLRVYNAGGAELPIEEGPIYMGGAQRVETLGDQLYIHLQRVAERSGNVWRLNGYVGTDGRLRLRGEWLQDIGEEGGILMEGTHLALSSPTATEETPIWNRVTGLGDATTSGTRLSVTMEDAESIGRYGARSTSIVFSGNTTIETLTENTREYLRRYARPRLQINCVVVEGYIGMVRLGNWYTVELYSAGFGDGIRARARVRAMQYSDETRTLEATMEVSDYDGI